HSSSFSSLSHRPSTPTLFPYTTLFRSDTVSENSLFGFTISTEYPLAIAVKPSTKEKPLENIPIKTAATDDNSIIGTIGFLAKARSEEHTSELQSRFDLVCRLLLEKKKK